MGRSPEDATTMRASGRPGFPGRAAGLLLVVLLAIAGMSMVLEATGFERLQPPQPPPGQQSQTGEAAGGSGADAAPPLPAVPDELVAAAPGMSRSEPLLLRIPRIGVNSRVMKVGLDDDGKVATPPLEKAERVGWYERGPSPGEVGNSVVVGHVDSYAMGEAVFFELGALRPGDQVEVLRFDGEVARFVVERVESHPKDEFPSEDVYGPAGRPQLRLITCGGEFDEDLDDYPDNIIVFATLVP